MLHDGTIVGYTGDTQRLQLTVSCLYLAERIASEFEVFYLDLLEVGDLRLEAWLDDGRTAMLTDWPTIFTDELELASAEVGADGVVIWCPAALPTLGAAGGRLSLRCAAIQVYDQHHQTLTVTGLRQLATDYWRGWAHHDQA